MATTSTYKKRQRIAPRQRLSTTDIEDISKLGMSNQAEDNHALVSVDDYVIEGMQIVHASGQQFNCNAGAVLVNGEILKLPASTSLGNQDAIAIGTDNRIDIAYINPSDPYTDTVADSATKTVLSSLSATNVTGEAVGTGDDVTKTWDLANGGVDPSTLVVKVAASQETGGWVFSQGTGSGSVDQIIFNTAPGSGNAITADYTYYSGGAESSSSENTRYNRIPKVQVWKGTEGAVVAYATELAALLGSVSDAVLLGAITYGTGWSTGAPSSVDNSIKSFMLTPDNLGEPSGETHTPNKTAAGSYAGRLLHPLRNIHGLKHGFRLRWSSATEIKVGPGWAVVRGVAMYSNSDIAFTPTWGIDISATGWHYVYLSCQPTNTTAPGSSPDSTLFISTASPDELLRENSLGDVGTFYVGAIYNTSGAGVAIREFYSYDSGWVYWASANLSSTLTTGSDHDIAAECPVTGRLVDIGLTVSFTGGTGAGDTCSVVLASHKGTPSAPLSSNEPDMQIYFTAFNNTDALFNNRRGILRAEQSGSARYINSTESTSSGTAIVKMYVAGYYDDALSMSGSTALAH